MVQYDQFFYCEWIYSTYMQIDSRALHSRTVRTVHAYSTVALVIHSGETQ